MWNKTPGSWFPMTETSHGSSCARIWNVKWSWLVRMVNHDDQRIVEFNQHAQLTTSILKQDETPKATAVHQWQWTVMFSTAIVHWRMWNSRLNLLRKVRWVFRWWDGLAKKVIILYASRSQCYRAGSWIAYLIRGCNGWKNTQAQAVLVYVSSFLYSVQTMDNLNSHRSAQKKHPTASFVEKLVGGLMENL